MKKPTETKPRAPRGFAVIPKAIGRKIASLGGKAVSKDREWMRALGRKGGQAKRRKVAA